MTYGHLEFFPVTSRWCYESDQILSCRCVEGRTLIKYVKFCAVWTSNTKIITILCIVLKNKNSLPHNGYTF